MEKRKRRIAVPAENDKGLDAPACAHFGHCGCFILVDVEGKETKEVTVLPNEPHVQGGCAAPIMLLKEHQVDTLLVGGMGMRPLVIAHQQGIEIFGGISGSVGDAVRDLLDNKLPVMDENQTCRH